MKFREVFWHKYLKRPYRLRTPIVKGRGDSIVLLHGLGGQASDWLPAIEELNLSRYKVAAMDLLGFGDSPSPDFKQYTVEDHSASVIYTLKRLKIKKPIVLVGHSMGAVIAANVAASQPKLVKQVILYEVPAYSNMPGKNIYDLRNKAYTTIFSNAIKSPKFTIKTLEFLGRIASNFIQIKLDGKSWTAFERSLNNTVMQDSVFEDLVGLPVPVDVIYGRYDLLVMKRTMKKYFKKSSKVTFHEVNEAHRITAKTGKILTSLVR